MVNLNRAKETIMTSSNNADLINLFYQSEDYFFRSISLEYLDLDDSATAYCTGISAAWFNTTSFRKELSSIDAILKRCEAFYASHKRPWIVVLPDSLNTQKNKDSLNRIGLDFCEKTLTMFIDLNQTNQADDHSNADIKTVNHQLDDWLTPLTKAFDSSSDLDAGKQYAHAHARALEKNVNFQHFSAYKDYIPISSITLSIHKNIARIDDLGTDPAYQKKGYATMLLTQAIAEAKKSGALYCFLEASEAGQSLYTKIGFKPLFKNNIYMP